MNEDAQRWNKRYRNEQDIWLDHLPKSLLIMHSWLLPETGRALDAAGGVGANALYLGNKGFEVYLLDISDIAVELAHKRFSDAGLSLHGVVADLANFWLPNDYFDVILNFCFLERASLPLYHKALKPGGFLFFETFTNEPADLVSSEHYLMPGELETAFAGFDIIHSEETYRRGNKKVSERRVKQFVARKPML